MQCLLVAMNYLAPYDYSEPERHADAIVDDYGTMLPISTSWFYLANRWLDEDAT